MNTEITYLYRDASNYKFFGSIVVAGRIEIADIEGCFFDSEFFVPEAVGLPSLVPEVTNEDDHLLHTIVAMESTDKPASPIFAANLINEFRRRAEIGWFLGLL
jgi:hypothetical protein